MPEVAEGDYELRTCPVCRFQATAAAIERATAIVPYQACPRCKEEILARFEWAVLPEPCLTVERRAADA